MLRACNPLLILLGVNKVIHLMFTNTEQKKYNMLREARL